MSAVGTGAGLEAGLAFGPATGVIFRARRALGAAFSAGSRQAWAVYFLATIRLTATAGPDAASGPSWKMRTGYAFRVQSAHCISFVTPLRRSTYSLSRVSRYLNRQGIPQHLMRCQKRAWPVSCSPGCDCRFRDGLPWSRMCATNCAIHKPRMCNYPAICRRPAHSADRAS